MSAVAMLAHERRDVQAHLPEGDDEVDSAPAATPGLVLALDIRVRRDRDYRPPCTRSPNNPGWG